VSGVQCALCARKQRISSISRRLYGGFGDATNGDCRPKRQPGKNKTSISIQSPRDVLDWSERLVGLVAIEPSMLVVCWGAAVSFAVNRFRERRVKQR
jgi:hypothetical protein